MLTRVLVRNRARLFDEIHLKPDEKLDGIRFPGYGYHGEKIHERLATSPIIDETYLCLPAQVDHVFEVQDRIVVDVLSFRAGLDFPVG